MYATINTIRVTLKREIKERTVLIPWPTTGLSGSQLRLVIILAGLYKVLLCHRFNSPPSLGPFPGYCIPLLIFAASTQTWDCPAVASPAGEPWKKA